MAGTWFNDDNQQFNDAAEWLSPVSENGIDGRIYDLQNVIFTNRTGQARYGWNMSHADVAYVWGWDAKDNNNQNGERGTHIGWTFAKGTAQCIIWATLEEAFLECIKPKCTGKQRASTGFFGMGQWTIGDTSSFVGGPPHTIKDVRFTEPPEEPQPPILRDRGGLFSPDTQ